MGIASIKHQNLKRNLIESRAYLGPYKDFAHKSLHPMLLGQRNKMLFYHLDTNLQALQRALGLMENIISRGGKILFLEGPPALPKILPPQSGGIFRPWTYGVIEKADEPALIVLHNPSPTAIQEAKKQQSPILGFVTEDLRGIDYPILLNLASPFAQNFYLSLVREVFLRGLRKGRK
uniref:Ribosomal protein S2 n=1 Tax=Schizocladia ischiensis TaxID=196139 RepID=A0A7S6UA52_9STRA|nr:ribosomal protein S2 [Schizocladia ischiensis]QOW07616.1 ribosomal protein S2 [Schizocladia ischiensis]